MTLYVVGALGAFAGGFVQGCVGFGMAIILTPLMMLVAPQEYVIPMVVIIGFTNVVLLTWRLYRNASREILVRLVLGAAIGIPLGVQVLAAFSGPGFRVALGLFMVVFAAVMFSGWTRPLRNQRAALLWVGLASGFLGGSTSISEPPLVIFLSNQRVSKEVFRATMVCYFALTGVIGLASFAWKGLITAPVVTNAAACLPLMLLGTYFGMRLATRVSEEHFRRASMAAAGIMGAVLTANNLPGLF
ncbi:MAG: sulfite exporter TauE/SafE family protein [Candidatus Hydrogenedentota bacterium]